MAAKPHIIIVGRGMIGSGAARHLAKAGHKVTLIGPDEPSSFSTHTGVFASHYDEGRITRQLDTHPFWGPVSRASIARYAEIAAESGINFYTEVGALQAGPSGSDWIAGLDADAATCAHGADRLFAAELTDRFAFLNFPDDWVIWHETQRAGHISPRKLVAALGQAAQAHGATLVNAKALGIDVTADHARVTTADQTYTADAVLVAAGGFTSTLVDVPIEARARTVAFFDLDAAEAQRLSGMPSIIYQDRPGLAPYILPPIRYPDGSVRLKIGGDPKDQTLPTKTDMQDWFRSGGSSAVADWLEDQLRAIVPNLKAVRRHHAPCVTTFTTQNVALIDRLDARLTVATAGSGRAAKCCDELGRIAALAVTGGEIRPELSLQSAG